MKNYLNENATELAIVVGLVAVGAYLTYALVVAANIFAG